MKTWLITAEAPICGTSTYYCAFSDGDPLDKDDFPYDEITAELWDNYSWLLHLEDEEYESEEEYDEAYIQAYEDWKCDCNIYSDEMSLKDLQDYIPGGPKSDKDLPDVIYDER